MKTNDIFTGNALYQTWCDSDEVWEEIIDNEQYFLRIAISNGNDEDEMTFQTAYQSYNKCKVNYSFGEWLVVRINSCYDELEKICNEALDIEGKSFISRIADKITILTYYNRAMEQMFGINIKPSQIGLHARI